MYILMVDGYGFFKFVFALEMITGKMCVVTIGAQVVL